MCCICTFYLVSQRSVQLKPKACNTTQHNTDDAISLPALQTLGGKCLVERDVCVAKARNFLRATEVTSRNSVLVSCDAYYTRLFANLDKLLAPDRPCHSNLWLAILALHKALADQPRFPSVVAAFSHAVHNGGDVIEAVKITREITKPHNRSFFELLEPEKLDSQTLMDEIMDLEASTKEAL
ncbi:unnamed protein product [Arabis nemorensis]|uniref:Uncharacterized protein n=1 Tax=Arabis nemorensis TaxID=586526 RepID=A0A565BK69_9BRAS|nr:unnamed protein product [Arabis nemorensis]